MKLISDEAGIIKAINEGRKRNKRDGRDGVLISASPEYMRDHFYVAQAQLEACEKEAEEKVKELDSIIKRLTAEIYRLSSHSISPIDIVAQARAELADLEVRKLKRC